MLRFMAVLLALQMQTCYSRVKMALGRLPTCLSDGITMLVKRNPTGKRQWSQPLLSPQGPYNIHMSCIYSTPFMSIYCTHTYPESNDCRYYKVYMSSLSIHPLAKVFGLTTPAPAVPFAIFHNTFFSHLCECANLVTKVLRWHSQVS